MQVLGSCSGCHKTQHFDIFRCCVGQHILRWLKPGITVQSRSVESKPLKFHFIGLPWMCQCNVTSTSQHIPVMAHVYRWCFISAVLVGDSFCFSLNVHRNSMMSEHEPRNQLHHGISGCMGKQEDQWNCARQFSGFD